LKVILLHFPYNSAQAFSLPQHTPQPISEEIKELIRNFAKKKKKLVYFTTYS